LAAAIRKYKGEASVAQVQAMDDLPFEKLVQLFIQARSKDYEALTREAKKLISRNKREPGELARLRRRFQEITAIDFFNSPLRGRVEALLESADSVGQSKSIPESARKFKRQYGSGGIAVFDSEGNRVGDVKVDAHPESFQLETNGPRIFVNLPHSQKVLVIDRNKSAVVASWTTDDAQANFPTALDETDGRLFIICRKPAGLLVLDTTSGSMVAKLPTVGDSDDLFYDQRRKRLYSSDGEGKVIVYQQQDADHYSQIAEIETVKGARTSLFVPQLSRLFVAVRQEGGNTAAIRVYEATD